MRIYTRADWHARTPRAMTEQSPPTEAFVHHSADVSGHSPFNTFTEQAAHMRSVQDYHMGKGWSDISYHYVVFQDKSPNSDRSVAFAARNAHYVPAAQEGHNTRTLAICVVGNGENEEMDRNTRYVIERLIQMYPSVRVVGGHRDVTPTTCPGDKFYGSIPRIAKAAGVRVY